MEPRVMRIYYLVVGCFFVTTNVVPQALSATTYDQRQEGKVNVQIDVKDVQIVALVDSEMLEEYMNYDYAYDYTDFTIKPRPTSSKPTTSSSATAEALSTWPTKPAGNSSMHEQQSSTTASPQTTAKDETSTILVAPLMAPFESSNSSDIPVMGNSTILGIPETASKAVEANVTNGTEIMKLKVVEGEARPTSSVEISTLALKDVDKAAPENEANMSTTVLDENGSTTLASDIKLDGLRRTPVMPEPRKRCPAGFFFKSGRCFKRRLSLISPRLAFMKLAPALSRKLVTQRGFLSTLSS